MSNISTIWILILFLLSLIYISTPFRASIISFISSLFLLKASTRFLTSFSLHSNINEQYIKIISLPYLFLSGKYSKYLSLVIQNNSNLVPLNSFSPSEFFSSLIWSKFSNFLILSFNSSISLSFWFFIFNKASYKSSYFWDSFFLIIFKRKEISGYFLVCKGTDIINSRFSFSETFGEESKPPNISKRHSSIDS